MLNPMIAGTTAVGARRQRGMSLVEMMVGVAVGLFIVAGAATLAASQLGENRRLLLEAQVQQDLRSTADIITRELRRTGGWRVPETLTWTPSTEAQPNPYVGIEAPSGGDVVRYHYWRLSSPSGDYRYALVDNVIVWKVGATSQELTDRQTLLVDEFTVARQNAGTTVQLACPNLCSDGTQACWPTMALSDVVVTIRGHSPSDPLIQRSVTSRIRSRNDGVKFNVSPTQVCP